MSKKRTNGGMAKEYDFSTGVRGKFHRAGALLSPPVHLEPAVLRFIQAKAKAQKTTVSALVNELLKKDIELIETVG
jgi:hypothetical protein